MSQRQQRNLEALNGQHKQKHKKNENEDESDEEEQDSEKKQLPNKLSSSNRKVIKRDNSKISGNKSMTSDSKGESSHEVGEDSDEEEDDYDDEDSSNGSFIASEQEVEREREEEERRKAAELKGGSTHKKKKKKAHKHKQLDDEDLELIKANTGKEVKRQKKLKKIAEQEEEAKLIEQTKQRRTEVKDENMQDDTIEAQENRQINTSHQQKRQQSDHLRQQNLLKQEQFQEVMTDSYEVARGIFKDPKALQYEIDKRKRMEGATDTENQVMKQENLQDMFDGNEIDDQYATKPDKIIAEKDIPERLQLKIKERLSPDSDELNQEAKWIFDRFINEKARNDFSQNPELVKKKIEKILSLFRQEHLDIPMITMYRKYEYLKELEEQDVWTIFNMDLEYGKFMHEKEQICNFIQIVSEYDPELRGYLQDINYASTQSQLNDFAKQMSFLQKYYYEELGKNPNFQRRKNPVKNDKIQVFKKFNLDQFARQCLLKPQQFTRNLQSDFFKFVPPEITDLQPINLAQRYLSDLYDEEIKVLTGVCQFAAEELGTEPYIRSLIKKLYMDKGRIICEPTDKGKKDLDVFNPSYTVKRYRHAPLKDLLHDDDIFLDIQRCVDAGLITMKVEVDKDDIATFHAFLEQYYLHPTKESPWNLLRKEVLRILQETVLPNDIAKEIQEELREAAENTVIQKCQEKFRELLMIGPFQCTEQSQRAEENKKGKGKEEEIIKDRERLCVMGVVLHQLDAQNQIVTVSIVDKFGELLIHKDFMHLVPPRKLSDNKRQQFSSEEDKERLKKLVLQHNEQQAEHDKDIQALSKMIQQNQVDLIVVGANKLDAKRIFDTLKQVAANVKQIGVQEEEGGADDNAMDEGLGRKKQKKVQLDQGSAEDRKEAIVIWGSLEIPKLFSVSHQSQKLLENCNPVLKQCVSLSRFEQDPMAEALNLWSSSPSENYLLQSNLHPLQRLVNQAKFQDALEDVAVQCVCNVGVDINMIVEHEHLHSLLQFVSGLGPRKAKNLIQSVKAGQRLVQRGDIFKLHYMQKICYMSTIGFLKIRIPPEEINKSHMIDIFDQTRIHQQSYALALKVATDVIHEQKQVDKFEQYKAVKDVIKDPKKLKQLDLQQYRAELEQTGQAHMTLIIDQIFEEFDSPFKDPREYRTPTNIKITPLDLFYMLIDETERTFKRGIIVTATVTKVLEDKVFCKLDNGLDACIFTKDLIGGQAAQDRRQAQDAIQVGHVISGRINEIKIQGSKEGQAGGDRFSVTLNCRKEALENHREYIDQTILDQVPEEDLKNHNFQIEKKSQQQSRYQSRRINHPKFKNLSSTQAIQELKNKSSVGDFLFRPSSKGPNNITLTWYFYTNCLVHIDITELDKPIGASIGSRLMIGEEEFENLPEIIERYIHPSNKCLREALCHNKFKECISINELEDIIKREKSENSTIIPYKFTILEAYPQHLVLGYIPKDKFIREFIKVKPTGYFFHGKRHQTIQNVINWFKENFNKKEYYKEMKKTKSPRSKPNLPDPLQSLGINSGTKNPDKDWEGIQPDWKPQGGNSVHSMNEEQPYQSTNFGNTDSQTPKMMKSENPGYSSKPSDYGGWGDTSNGGMTGAGAFSEYNNNSSSTMQRNDSERSSGGGRGRGRGGDRPPMTCFNCQETGHMSRECTQEKKSFRGGRGRGDSNGGERNFTERSESGGGRGRGRGRGFNRDEEDKSNGGGGSTYNNDGGAQASGWGANPAQTDSVPSWGAPPNSSPKKQPSWGGAADVDSTSKSPRGWGNDSSVQQNQEDSAKQSYGWGNATPARTDTIAGSGWGNENDNGGAASWGAANQTDSVMNDSPKNNYGDSDGGFRGGRGRGRGRGGNDGESMGRGRGGGSGGGRACFKCNQEGHMARECPNQQENSSGGGGRGRGSGGSGPRSCFKCGQEGHISRDCTEQSSSGASGRGRGRGRGGDSGDGGDFGGGGRGRGGGGEGCFKCKQPGHFARECPNSGGDDPYKGRDSYKRPRLDDGASRRRDEDASGSANDAWGSNDNAGGGAWGASATSQPDNQAWGASSDQVMTAPNDGGWGNQPSQENESQKTGWG